MWIAIEVHHNGCHSMMLSRFDGRHHNSYLRLALIQFQHSDPFLSSASNGNAENGLGRPSAGPSECHGVNELSSLANENPSFAAMKKSIGIG